MAAQSQQSSPHQNGSFESSGGYLQTMAFKGCSSIRDYEIMGKLGEGTFGEVHRAKSKKTGAIVALKKILMHNEKDGFPITALREIKLLKLLNHPNVLRLEEMAVEHAHKTGDKKRKSIMYMVTPYMDHDLSGLLENPKVNFTEPQIKCYLLQLLEGLRYLHGENILHRDMKAANLLINNKGVLQIADFGLARHYSEPAPVAGRGGGTATRDYTTLVVTRWYRPPELLMHLRKYTTAIDLWGVGCVFGEMLNGRPILAGDSDINQLKMIFELVGTPNDQSMPGFRELPGAQGLQEFGARNSTLNQRFRQYGSGAISLLNELLRLDWRKRINAIDALQHPYFRNEPLPAQPGDIPFFEESHELDRRKFRKEKELPPAPKGGTVGMGAPGDDWPNSGGQGFNQPQRYEGMNSRGHQRRPNNQNGHLPRSSGNYHSGNIPPPPPAQAHHPQAHNLQRRPAWERNGTGPDTRLPPRPPTYGSRNSDELNYGANDGHRSDETDRDRGIPPPPRSNPGGSRPPPNIDTYIPNYGADNRAVGRDRDRDRRDSYDREDRRGGGGGRDDRERGYHERDRDRRTRTRSRSPAVRERGGGRDHREREPLSRERDTYRR